MKLSHKINLLMKSHKLSETQLSLKANIGLNSLQDLLYGKKESLTLRQKIALAKVFNLEVTDLEALPTPEIDHNEDWVLTKEIIREWPEVFLSEFLKSTRNGAVLAHRNLKNLVRDQQQLAKRAQVTIEPADFANLAQMERAKVR